MDRTIIFKRKSDDRLDQIGGGSKLLNGDGVNEINKNISCSGGNNRSGKRYQNTRTIVKRKDNQKQHESLNDGSSLQDLNKQLQANLPEDMRISKLLRRLCQENDVKACLDLCSKLGVVILEPCNESYIRKSFDILADGIISVLENGPRDCLDQIAEVFGMMGYVNRNDFTAYRAWIIKYYKSSKRMKRAMMKAVKKTISLDIKGDMKEMASRLMDMLKDYLEAADTVDAFVTVTDVIVDICAKYPRCFQTHFTDIVDIVVGWHLETDQIPEVKNHCSKVLHSFKNFWNEDLEFTLNLLGQFVEDIESCCSELESSGSGDLFLSSAISFSSLLDAFNTVIKCLMPTPEILFRTVGREMVDNSFEVIVKASTIITKQYCLEEVLLPINECLIILLMLEPCAASAENEKILVVIGAEVAIVETLNHTQICSLLLLLLRYTEVKAANLPLEFLHLVWEPKSSFVKLRYQRSSEIREGLLKLYHSVLAIKNVETLEKAYKFILDDLSEAMELLKNSEKAELRTQSQYSINFNLLTLSTLAMANNSILVMWTLQPSILYVLLEKLHLLDYSLWNEFPNLHYAILRVAYQHSIQNSNFISSSTLLRSKSYAIVDSFHRLGLEATVSTSTASPTAEHFRLIIEFLENVLPRDTSPHHLNLLLDWCRVVISQVSQYYDVLLENSTFKTICAHICDISMRKDERLTLKCAECLSLMSSYKALASSCYQGIAEVCCLLMCSTNSEIRERFSHILAKLPLRYTLKQVSQFSGNNEQRNQQIYELQSWYVATENTGDLRSHYFRMFIDKISFQRESASIDDFLKEVFTKSWFVDEDKKQKYSEMALADLRCLIPWAQWEAAHFCVNNKLRTPIGKPQETFLKIESIIKEYARVLSMKESCTVKDLRTSMANQRHARILLGFLEALEKAIYNAAEGTAFALPSPEKPARTFFRVNSSTCAEWFNRIRTAVYLVALHCMEPEMVIRYAEAVLRELVVAKKFNDPIFEHTLMSLVWALLRNWESDALYGVYVWAKQVTGKKYAWIKMAAEEAAGHRETALEGFMTILSDPDCENLDRHIRDFIVDQITLSFIFTMRLPELYDFLVSEETRGMQRATIPLITLTPKLVESWIEYEKTKDKNAIDMADWDQVDFGTDITNNFSCHKLLSDTENSIAAIFMLQHTPEKEEKIRMCSEVVHSALQECLLTKSREFLFQMTITNHIVHIAQMTECTADDLKSIRVHKQYGSFTIMRVLSWIEFFDNSRKCQQNNMEMRLDLVSVARKENNFSLCQRELDAFYKSYDIAKLFGIDPQSITIDKIQQLLMSDTMKSNLWDVVLSRAVYEQCKWLYCQSNRKQAIQFASVATVGMHEKLAQINATSDNLLRERKARFLLTIADWVQNEDSKILNEPRSNTPLVKLINSLAELEPSADPRTVSIFSITDIVIGKLLQASVQCCPELAKAWYQFGSWSYRWGKKMVEFNTDGNTLHLINQEEIQKILPATSPENLQKIAIILNQHEVGEDEEEIGLNEMSSTGLLESLQTTIPELRTCSAEKLQLIVDIWRQTHRTVYGYYEIAASAYFRYLQVSSSIEMESENGNSSTVTATLRLLRLIVKHALGLKEVLEEGLATTPTNPWRVITPQLFSRLNHHEPYVRKRVSELLCRVAKDAPHLIIFPAVVGSVQEKKVDIGNISLDELDDDMKGNNIPDNSGLAFCFNALLEILSKDAPETVQQVQILVYELRRISLLWDELWVVSLQQIYSEYNKRFASFENELQKILESHLFESKKHLVIEKHKLLLRPLIFVMEQLYDMTSRPSQTIHEKHFQDRYLKYISAMIEKFKEPFDFKKPVEGWTRFKALLGQMQQRSQKKNSFSLRLAEISPILSKLSQTAISMPGIDCTQKQQIFISSVDNSVQILPTKTKPKKMMFYGSNGRRYSYLFKGLEDLHLDERIMQFLSIANLMMTKSIDCNGNITHYRAEHYSVIPLGPRSGLINWVDNTVPIFSLYKKWQQREALQKKDKPGTISRPSELYYQKLTPLLQKHGLKTSDNRKDWPMPVLKQVLKELQSDTPRDLLAKELWCHSTTAAAWRQVVRNYSLSLAVMSVIGYIIGLGDRHLDNVLVKLASGEIIHIDYNVCFEKGKTLRVPEKVPFRMTPNLEEALGITGIEGTFRLACEHVLKSLKKGRETLLTLLEAFVYDPLVDWAVNEDGGTAAFAVSTYGNREGFNSELRHAKKQLEREVNRDTLAIRFSEIKSEWNQNRDDIYQQLLLMQTLLQELKLCRLELCTSEGHRESLSRQIQVIREAESLESAIGSHPLNTLSQRYSVYKKIIDDHESAKSILLNKLSDAEQKLENYKLFWEDVKSQKLRELVSRVHINVEECSSSEFDQVRDFLEKSNLCDIFLKANECRHKLNDHILKLSMVLNHALELLNQYGMIISYYSNGCEENHWHFKFTAWYRKLIDENSAQSCHEVLHLHQQHAVKIRQQTANQQVISFSYHLANILSETGFRLTELVNYHAQELNESTVSVDQMYETSLSSINSIAFSNPNGQQILNCAAVKLFLDLSQNYLLLEQTASTAGDSLIDLQLNDNWFLIELYMASAQLKALAQIMFDQSNENHAHHNDIYSIGFSCLSASVDIYEYLHTMNERIAQNFLTETMQGIISENQSVIDMISAVSNLQSNIPPLSQLLDELNMHLQCVVMNIPSSHCHSLTMVEELKQKFTSLGESYRLQETPTDGAKLYLTLHSLFNELLEKQCGLLRIVYDGMMLINEVDPLDHIKDSKDLAVLILNKSTNDVLESIFVVKRVQAIIEFFTSCLQIACFFKGSAYTVPFNDDFSVRAIRRFVSDLVYHSMLGVGPIACGAMLYGVLQRNNPTLNEGVAMHQQLSYNKDTIALQELCNATIEHTLSAVHISQQEYNNANNAYINLGFMWRKKMRIKLLSERIITEQITLNRIQTLFVAHNWLHEIPTNQPQREININTNRSAVVIQLQTFLTQLSSIKLTLQNLHEEIRANTNTILHRLKWASGANSEIIYLLQSFEQASMMKQEFLDEYMLYLDIALKHCSSVLDHEIIHLQKCQDQQDQEFIELVEKFKNACTKLVSGSTMVNRTEIALVELLDPEGQIDHVWLDNVRALIDDMTDQVHTKIARMEKETRNAQENLHMSAHKLRSLISAHHSLASDVRNLLKIKLKMDSSPALREYLLKYKAFLETISELHSNVLSKDFTDGLVQHAMQQVQSTLPNVHSVFDKLFAFDQGSDDDHCDEGNELDRSEKVLGEVIHSPDKRYTNEGKPDKGQTQKEQKRNAYAVSVWRRIRMKLEGRDPDPNRRCTVQEQVEWMVQEAMDPDNLAVLYEGWTPWV